MSPSDQHDSEVEQLRYEIEELESELPPVVLQSPAAGNQTATLEFKEELEGWKVKATLMHSSGKEVDVADRHITVDGPVVTVEIAEIYDQLYGAGEFIIETTVERPEE